MILWCLVLFPTGLSPPPPRPPPPLSLRGSVVAT